jgi:hypothetical protein
VVRVQGRLRGDGRVRGVHAGCPRPEQLVPVWGDLTLEWDAAVAVGDETAVPLNGVVPPARPRSSSTSRAPSDAGLATLRTRSAASSPSSWRSRTPPVSAGGFRLDAREPVARWSDHARPVRTPYRYRVRKVWAMLASWRRIGRTRRDHLLIVRDTNLRVETIEAIVVRPADTLGRLLRFRSLDPPPTRPPKRRSSSIPDERGSPSAWPSGSRRRAVTTSRGELFARVRQPRRRPPGGDVRSSPPGLSAPGSSARARKSRQATAERNIGSTNAFGHAAPRICRRRGRRCRLHRTTLGRAAAVSACPLSVRPLDSPAAPGSGEPSWHRLPTARCC